MDLININVEEQYQKISNLNKDLSKKLIEWIDTQLDLPSITEYEAMLFLNATYQHLDQAKKLVTDYYTYRTCNPDIFGNRNIFSDDMDIAKSNVMFVPLPGVTEEGYNVLYCKITKEDASEYNVIKALKLFVFASDLWIQQNGITPGDVIVFDTHYFTNDHIKKYSDDSVTKAMTMLQDIFLARLKGFYLVNTSIEFDAIDKLLKLMAPQMEQEFKNILQVHPTMETVFKIIPKEILPNELGGGAGTRKELQEKYWEVLKQNAHYFLEEERTKRLKGGCPK